MSEELDGASVGRPTGADSLRRALDALTAAKRSGDEALSGVLEVGDRVLDAAGEERGA